jgi:hypothetical protein
LHWWLCCFFIFCMLFSTRFIGYLVAQFSGRKAMLLLNKRPDAGAQCRSVARGPGAGGREGVSRSAPRRPCVLWRAVCLITGAADRSRQCPTSPNDRPNAREATNEAGGGNSPLLASLCLPRQPRVTALARSRCSDHVTGLSAATRPPLLAPRTAPPLPPPPPPPLVATPLLLGDWWCLWCLDGTRQRSLDIRW